MFHLDPRSLHTPHLCDRTISPPFTISLIKIQQEKFWNMININQKYQMNYRCRKESSKTHEYPRTLIQNPWNFLNFSCRFFSAVIHGINSKFLADIFSCNFIPRFCRQFYYCSEIHMSQVINHLRSRTTYAASVAAVQRVGPLRLSGSSVETHAAASPAPHSSSSEPSRTLAFPETTSPSPVLLVAVGWHRRQYVSVRLISCWE
jgi:hypothetical protein